MLWLLGKLLRSLGKLLLSLSKLLRSPSKLLRSLSELLGSWSKLLLRLLSELLLRLLYKLLLGLLGKLRLRGLSKLLLRGWLPGLWSRSRLSDLRLWCRLSCRLTSGEIVELSLWLLSWGRSLRSYILRLRFTPACHHSSPCYPTSGSFLSFWLRSCLEGWSSLACWSPICWLF